MHLLASLAAHGWHPAAWRVSGTTGFAGAAPFKAAAQTAERGGLDAVLLGLPAAPLAVRAARVQRPDLPTDDKEAALRLAELIDVARQLWDSWEDRGFIVDQSTGT